MNSRTLRTIAFFAIICIVGIAMLQIFWFRKAFDLKEKEFNQTVHVALQSVGEYILTSNSQQIPLEPLVNQISGNYFIVQTNGQLHPRPLEFLLKNEFKKRNIRQDFEYGLYNCESKKMIYGNYISLDEKPELILPPRKELPTETNDNLYFGVYFPNKESTLLGQMGIWLFSSFVMLLVCLFFIFTLLFIFRQKQLSEIQKDFINNITHEFKTPLSTIAISSEILKNPKVYQSTENITKYTTLIQEEVKRLKGQVESVLQVAALDKESMRMKLEETNLQDTIMQAVNGVELLVQSRQGEIRLNIEPNLPEIKIDRMHVQNVMFNLLENAVKYSPESPQVSIHAFSHNKGICIQVSDKGVGIPSEYHRKVFDRFFRVPTGNIHNVKGFGLGLYYAKMIMDAHKGRISVKSGAGGGCTFELYFPS